MLRAHQLRSGYTKNDTIQDVTFSLARGDIVGIIGPNGAGKSTLLDTLAGLLPRTSGDITYDGTSLDALRPKERAKMVTLLSQRLPPYRQTVEQFLTLARYAYDDSKEDEQIIDRALDVFELAKWRHQSLASLSGGERQRVYLAKTYVQETPYLLLDEPATYLDLGAEQTLYRYLQALAKKGKGILLVSHNMNSAAMYCDRLLLLQNGRLLTEGRPKEVLTKERLKKVFGAELETIEVSDTYQFIWKE